MDRELASDGIAELIVGNDDHRTNLMSTAPPPRPVDVQSRNWEVWLRDGGRVGSTSFVGPIEPARSAAALAALRGLAHRDPARRGADREIDREQLVVLSERAARSNERRCVTLWVATMMWGSGTMNGRGPWRTAEGLASPDLGPLLTQSHRLLRAGDLVGAYEVASVIPGSGEPTFTKWLWAAALALPSHEVAPLILDSRIRTALAGIDQQPAHSPEGYVDYCAAMHSAATKVCERTNLAGTTAEKLELLLGHE